jgi:hypothetical protein
MILKKFEYSEFKDTSNSWSLDGLDLENINLLVGKNATGKTNTLTRIDRLGYMIAGKPSQIFHPSNYDVEFTHGKDVYRYKLNLSSHKVEYEELVINDEQKFERKEDGTGQISTTQFSEKMKFLLSPNQLVVTSKRDAIQHPFLEELAKWAEGQRMYAFGSDMGKYTILDLEDIGKISNDSRGMNSIAGLYIKGDTDFSQIFGKRVIDSMKSIGYELDGIGASTAMNRLYHTQHIDDDDITGMVLYIRENDSDTKILQTSMSQGMFRALSLIIQITFNTLKKLSTTILIDDIGEGLDFERSTKLINLLVELAEKNDNIQLIMSTNDRYVMNNVPFKYWQLIDRKGGKCNVYNYRNSQKIFDEFKYTGLNNFDFLATDFIHSEREQE